MGEIERSYLRSLPNGQSRPGGKVEETSPKVMAAACILRALALLREASAFLDVDEKAALDSATESVDAVVLTYDFNPETGTVS